MFFASLILFFQTEIVVSATATENDPYRTPKSVTVLTGEEIRKKGARSVPEILNQELGIRVQETNLGGGSPILRGLIGNQVLILIDGIRLNNATTRLGPNQYLNTIDPNIIERIEIVRGPGSVLYGSDAAGGVIQIFTKRRRDFSEPSDADHAIYSRVDSAAKSRRLSFETQGNWGGGGYLAVLSAAEFSDLRAGEDAGKQANTGYGPESNFFGNFIYRIDEAREWTFAALYSNQQNIPRTDRLNGGPGGSARDRRNEIDPQRLELYSVRYRDRGLSGFAQEMDFGLSLQRQSEPHEQQGLTSSNLTREAFEDKTFGVSLQFHKTFPSGVGGQRHRLTYGAETYIDDVDSFRNSINLNTGVVSAQQSQFPNNSIYQSLGFYLQDEIALSDSADLVPGIRWSNFSQSGTLPVPVGEVHGDFSAFTWSLDFGYDLNSSWRFVLGSAQGFRAPNLDDTMVFNVSTNQGVDVPNPDLDAEVYRNLETGLRWREEGWRGSLLGFYTWIDDLIQRVSGTFQGSSSYNGSPVFTRDNVGRAFVQGVELEMALDLGGCFEGFSNLSWTAGRETSNDQPFRRIPPFGGTLGISYEEAESRGFWANLSCEFALAQQRLNSNDIADIRIGPGGTGSYALYHLRMGKWIGERTHVFAAVENMLNHDYRIHGSGLDGPGRNLILGLETHF